MKKTMSRLFAILMTLAIAITVIPMLEAKAEEKKGEVVTVDEYYIDEDNCWVSEENTYIVEKGTTYKELLDIIAAPEAVDNITFLGWEYMNGLEAVHINLSDVVTSSDGPLSIEAKYDKYPVTVSKIYIENTGKAKVDESLVYYPADTLFRDIYEEMSVTPEDASADMEIMSWGIEYWIDLESTVSTTNLSLMLFAQYEDVFILQMENSYVKDCGSYGIDESKIDYLILKKSDFVLDEENSDTFWMNFYDEYVKELQVDYYMDAYFDKWQFYYGYDNDGDVYYDYIYGGTEYKDVIQVWFDMEEDSYVYFAEPGEVLTLPAEQDGYRLKWYYDNENYETESLEGYQYMVPTDTQMGTWISLKAEKGDKVPEQKGDIIIVILCITLLLLGAGVFIVRKKRRHFVR